MVNQKAMAPTDARRALMRRSLRYSSISLGLLWAVFALTANSRQMIYMVLPSLTEEYDFTPESAGLVSTIVTVSTALICVPAMVWADKGGHGWRRKYRHLPIVAGYTLFTFFTGFNLLTGSIGLFLLLQIISHAIGGASESLEVATAGEWWSKQRRGMALGIHHTGYPWGTLIGGFAVSALLAEYGPENWRLPFLLFPIPVAIVFTAYWFFAKKHRYDTVIDGINVADQTPPLAADVVHTDAISPREALRNPNITVSAIVALLANFGYFGLSFWLPQYLAFVANYSFAEVAAYSVLFTITGGLGQIVWGSLSDRMGRKLSLMLVMLWLTVAFVIFQFSDLGLGTLIVIQLFAGMAMNAPYTLVYTLAFDSAGKGSTGVASSIIFVGISIGGIAPLVIGWIIGAGGGFSSPLGYNIALYLMAGMMLASVVLIAFFTRETTGWFASRDKLSRVSRKSCGLPELQ